ncbi:MAG: redox-sensitive transcriptional activator SoxR [Pseudomonadota bacterium]
MARQLTKNDLIPIGEVARRTGLSVSAIRFYEDKRLIEPIRTAGNQRRFLRSDIRRVSFILIAQQLGLALGEIEQELARLPQGRTPNAKDWKRISQSIRGALDSKIAQLEKTRDRLDGCIGCGCLSLSHCQLYNKDDHLAEQGPGPRQVLP